MKAKLFETIFKNTIVSRTKLQEVTINIKIYHLDYFFKY